MKFNLKYLLLPLSIIVCISGNNINAMENKINTDTINTQSDNNIEIEEEINTNNIIINKDTDSYQHIFAQNYNKEYYDDVCNQCIEHIKNNKQQYKTFIESSVTVFNKLIEIVKKEHSISIDIYFDTNFDTEDDEDYIDENNNNNNIENTKLIAQLSDNFKFKSNNLLKELKVQENKLLNNNFLQLNNCINNAKNIKQDLHIKNYYILNLLNKLKAQCIVKLTNSINNSEDYKKQIDVIKDSQEIIDSIIKVIIPPNDKVYYTLKSEVDLLDRIYYNGSKLENRFNNLHNKVISALEDMINNHNSNNTFVTIDKENLNKLLDKLYNKNDKLLKFLQTDKKKFTEFNKIIGALQNTEKLTTKQYYEYITNMLTILKYITDNQIQKRLENHYTQVIFNNNEGYEDIITYYLSIAYLLLECGYDGDINNSKCKHTLIDVILHFSRYYQINFDFRTRYCKIEDKAANIGMPVNEYFYFNDYFHKHTEYGTTYKFNKHITKLLQNRVIQTLDTSEGSFNNMQLYEQLLYNMVYILVALQHNGNPEIGISDRRDFSPILRQFICIMCDNIHGRDFSCEAAFILYYKTMVDKLDKIIKKGICDGLVKLNSNKYDNQDTRNKVQNIDVIDKCDIIDAFREEYKSATNSIWYNTATKLFSSTKNFLEASKIETIVNNIKNNTTLGNNKNNTTQNTFDNLISFIIMIYNDKTIIEQEFISLLNSLFEQSNINISLKNNMSTILSIINNIEDKTILNRLLCSIFNVFISFYSNNFNNILPNNNDNEETKINKITKFINDYILGRKTEEFINKNGSNKQKTSYNNYLEIINAILKRIVDIKSQNIFEKYKNKDFSNINQNKIEGNERELYKDCLKEVYDLFSFVNIASHKILYKKYGVHTNNQQIFNSNNRLGNMSNSDLLIRFYNTFNIGEKFSDSFKNIATENDGLINSVTNFFHPEDLKTFLTLCLSLEEFRWIQTRK